MSQAEDTLDQTGGTHTPFSAQLWEGSPGSQCLWYFSPVGLTQLREGSVSDPEHPLPFHYQPSPTAIPIHLNPDFQHSCHCRTWVPPYSSSEFCFAFDDVDKCLLEIGDRNSCLLEPAPFKNSTSVKPSLGHMDLIWCFVRFIYWPFQVQN